MPYEVQERVGPRWPVVVSYSELDTYRQCPHKHALAYRRRWVPPTVSRPLDIGKAWHRILEEHYGFLLAAQRKEADLDDMPGYMAAAVDDVLTGMEEERVELLRWMYQGYVEAYGVDSGWTILAVEYATTVPLPTPAGGRSRYHLKTKIDLIIRDELKKIWVVDHKSGRNLPKEKELDIDDQFGLYTWAMRQLGKRVFGQIYSAVRAEKLVRAMTMEERFDRKRLYRVDRELDTLAIEAYRTARAAYSWDPDEAPRAPDTERCRWRCPFTDPCLAGRKSGGAVEVDFLSSAGFVQDFERH